MPRAQVRDEIRQIHRRLGVVPETHGALPVEYPDAGPARVGHAGGLGQEFEGPHRHGARAGLGERIPDRRAQGVAAGIVEGRTGRFRLLLPHRC